MLLTRMCVPPGFTGLSSAPSLWTSKHLRPLVWQKADLCAAQICPFPECNVQLIRESLEQTLLARPRPPDHYVAFTERRRARTRCSISPGRQGEPRANRWKGDRGPTGLTLSLLFVVPLRDLDLITIFIAASFCVAFFSSL